MLSLPLLHFTFFSWQQKHIEGGHCCSKPSQRRTLNGMGVLMATPPAMYAGRCHGIVARFFGLARIPAAGACPNSPCATKVRPDGAAHNGLVNRSTRRGTSRLPRISRRSKQSFPLLSRWQGKPISHERACKRSLSSTLRRALSWTIVFVGHW